MTVARFANVLPSVTSTTFTESRLPGQIVGRYPLPAAPRCFYLFESESAELIEETSAAAGIELTRVLRVAVACEP